MAYDFHYAEILENLLPISSCYWHKEAKVPWLYHPDREFFISYDDPESLKWKANYVKEHDLKGVMFWELSGDDAEGSLIDALVEGLK